MKGGHEGGDPSERGRVVDARRQPLLPALVGHPLGEVGAEV
jgi:hypothetical protein